MTKQIILTLLLIPILFLFTSPVSARQNQDPSHDKQEHTVNITVQLLPVYATDKDGNPVFDLKQEDIQLFVNGKPIEILLFNQFKTKTTETTQSPEKPKTTNAFPPTPERINVLVFDSVISGFGTIAGSVLLAAEMIRRATPGDSFVLITNNYLQGFKYIVGPTKNKTELFQVLAIISQGKTFKKHNAELVDGEMNSEVSNKIVNNLDPSDIEFLIPSRAYLRTNPQNFIGESFNKKIRDLAHDLIRFKDTLKTFNRNKAVYLFTGGSRYMRPLSYYALEKAAKAINHGGSMFYIVNPIPYRSPQRRTALKFMSDFVNGGHISGKSTEKLIEQVRNSTSAYYELVFQHQTTPGQKLKIKLKSNRKDIKLATLKYTKQEVPYKMMKKRQRRAFILNVVHGGSWSRGIADVKLTKFGPVQPAVSSSFDDPRNAGKPLKGISIPIPKALQEKRLHIYKVTTNKKTLKTDFRMFKKEPGKLLNMYFSRDLENYFVIIDPSTSTILYNKLNLN